MVKYNLKQVFAIHGGGITEADKAYCSVLFEGEANKSEAEWLKKINKAVGRDIKPRISTKPIVDKSKKK